MDFFVPVTKDGVVYEAEGTVIVDTSGEPVDFSTLGGGEGGGSEGGELATGEDDNVEGTPLGQIVNARLMVLAGNVWTRLRGNGNGMYVQRPLRSSYTFNVESGESLTEAQNFSGNGKAVALQLPANIDGATELTFESSLDSINFGPVLKADGTEVKFTAVAGGVYPLDVALFGCFTYMKFRFGTKAVPHVGSLTRPIIVYSQKI